MGFSVFLSLKMILGRLLSSLPFKMVVAPLCMSRVSCSSRSGLRIFAASKSDFHYNE